MVAHKLFPIHNSIQYVNSQPSKSLTISLGDNTSTSGKVVVVDAVVAVDDVPTFIQTFTWAYIPSHSMLPVVEDVDVVTVVVVTVVGVVITIPVVVI